MHAYSLITDYSSGLGRGLVESYLNFPNTHVFATVRNPSDASSESLNSLPKAENSSITLLKLEAANEQDYPALAQSLSQDHDVQELHLIIANAAIGKVASAIKDAKTVDFLENFQINTLGPLLLFQHLRPLLASGAKFVPISSKGGSIKYLDEFSVPNAEYGTSKIALNYLTRKMSLENEDLVVFPLDPGFVQTDMGLAGAKAFGMNEQQIADMLITTKESVDGMVNVIEGATREKNGGKFMRYNGEETEW